VELIAKPATGEGCTSRIERSECSLGGCTKNLLPAGDLLDGHHRTKEKVLARIPVWDEKDPSTPPEVREALEYIDGEFGEIINFWRVIANHPEVARRYVDLMMVPHGEDSTITPAQRELAYTTATVVNNCHY